MVNVSGTLNTCNGAMLNPGASPNDPDESRLHDSILLLDMDLVLLLLLLWLPFTRIKPLLSLLLLLLLPLLMLFDSSFV